jgi:hypothetical protein
MSLDEFGRDLYDAIVLRAASVMASNGAKRMREQGHVMEAVKAEQSAKTADEALHKLLDRGTIKPADVRRLLSIQ